MLPDYVLLEFSICVMGGNFYNLFGYGVKIQNLSKYFWTTFSIGVFCFRLNGPQFFGLSGLSIFTEGLFHAVRCVSPLFS